VSEKNMEYKCIAVPSRTKEILAKYDLRAKKGFGQNFLVDPVIVRRCAEEAQAEGAVIEIGPGIGSLTEQLCLVSKHVCAYEIDERLLTVLEDTLSPYENKEIILQDFLKSDVHEKVKELKSAYGKVSVAANLPYYITTEILFRLFEMEEISCITVMVQKEVGDRFAAKPNDAEYGALSVEGQYAYEVKKLFTVPGRSFNPSPAVDSVVIQFKRREDLPSDIDMNDFFTVVRALFQQRRKTVYNNLKEYLGSAEEAKAALEAAGIDEKRRAQSMSVSEMENLYRRIRNL